MKLKKINRIDSIIIFFKPVQYFSLILIRPGRKTEDIINFKK